MLQMELNQTVRFCERKKMRLRSTDWVGMGNLSQISVEVKARRSFENDPATSQA